jgi:hypothetical protein
MKLVLAFALVTACGAGLLAAVTAWSWRTSRFRARRGCRTVGVVIDHKVTRGTTGAPSWTYFEARHAIVRYTDRHGDVHTMPAGSQPIGALVPVVYSPRRPGRAEQEITGANLGCGLAAAMVAAAAIIMAVLTA